MNFKFEWKLVKIYPTEKVGEQETEKRTIVLLESNEDVQYPQSISIDLRKEKTKLIEEKDLKVGDTVSVPFTVWSNENKDKTKHYNSISAWNIRKVEKN